jgi:prepilin-type N-terminal cleavage/methylation domain-containing protein
MRSTERRRGQGGFSLVEVVVASALMGIGVVGGLTAWDTASLSAARAVRIAWANCIVRSEMDAILSSNYNALSYRVPDAYGADGTLQVAVEPMANRPEELVTVTAYDPTSNHTVVLAQVSALKAAALAGGESMDSSGVLDDVALGCPER